MFNVIGTVLLACIVSCLGLLVKWEFKRARKGPRFNAIALKADRNQESPGPIYVPPSGARRAFENDRRR
jgi:hypothetical protein